MSAKTHVFQNVLKAANATAFAVTDEGFAMTEAQLNAIDEQLAANATTIKTLSAQIANPVDASAAAKTTQDLATAKQQIATLTTQLEQANTAKTTAEAEVAKLKKQPGAFFPGVNNDQDPEPAGASDELKRLNAAFDKEAAELL